MTSSFDPRFLHTTGQAFRRTAVAIPQKQKTKGSTILHGSSAMQWSPQQYLAKFVGNEEGESSQQYASEITPHLYNYKEEKHKWNIEIWSFQKTKILRQTVRVAT